MVKTIINLVIVELSYHWGSHSADGVINQLITKMIEDVVHFYLQAPLQDVLCFFKHILFRGSWYQRNLLRCLFWFCVKHLQKRID